ncbi:MAG: N-acetylneuraminate synthase [Chloroflexi bacterium]|nr:N-acetylneuraminate synthase [Chloroflexota bacterium]MBT3670059.1 N-acetylneuraminate synthase [Chloroflexota bacterium]MBT4002210.1 N-acetylneuraminate synthase [Chloroflexota bacterium]MBT4306739.1 N-acetylneuraminate synthase [Chloroflexota bacterium]MBT4532945.1 N-acetylneuraminate synthase [Chloroflexota bacterium]
MEITILDKKIGINHPTYFIADIAANHDGDLDRAVELIRLAKLAGADAAKFQNFRAPQIVSDYGFSHMNSQVSHQASWEKSVVEVYDNASIPFEWTPTLKDACDEFKIHYFSSPYDYEAIDMLDPYVPAYKAGSGLISWPDGIVNMAKKGKPILIATGASSIGEVARAMEMTMEVTDQIVLLQCNTNYTADEGNYDHLNINVLKTYAAMYPNVILGLSDHTQSPAPVVAAVALGARVIERHFTDSNDREGPDHKFALNPDTWADMVDQVRIVERSLGSSRKFITDNEKDTYIVQRRCLRAAREIKAGEIFTRDLIEVLRPATPGALMVWDLDDVIGKKARTDLPFGKDLRWVDLEE